MKSKETIYHEAFEIAANEHPNATRMKLEYEAAMMAMDMHAEIQVLKERINTATLQGEFKGTIEGILALWEDIPPVVKGRLQETAKRLGEAENQRGLK